MESGRPRGFVFVTYNSTDKVNSAINSLNGVDLDGRNIRDHMDGGFMKDGFFASINVGAWWWWYTLLHRNKSEEQAYVSAWWNLGLSFVWSQFKTKSAKMIEEVERAKDEGEGNFKPRNKLFHLRYSGKYYFRRRLPMSMDSTENMMPAGETIAPEAPSGYQLAPRSDIATLLTGPPGFSPPGSLVKKKKKRGRPRKYDPDGVVASGGGGESGRTLSPIPISASVPPTSEIKFGESGGSGGNLLGEKKKVKMSSSETKPRHGYGSMNLGDRISSGGSFTPHMVTVNPGEDVTSKIISFTKDGPRSICILSALGVISHVTLRHASSSVGTVTYEGRFEILSLSGSFTPDEFGGVLSQETNMSITLSSPDGRVVGGQLGGPLTAAGPVQVVVASFLPHIGSPIEPKPKKQKAIINPLTPALPSTESRADVDHQNLNEHARERPMAGNTNSTPTRNFQLEKCMTASVHDWRRAATDMNVSLNED
ncbi:hypothetical protein L1987_58907 [Smallanthus sonchifolius]|uniref:Uncharacterized protein n=1 Tax=Smallanthus sonchifolius TaxID=185202 RepID=A0ACB9D4C4_9ASTR|nr:hypothetical protein L1987_58907 [Smallanthus sonchifolius]